jgi:hypothetical protein
MMIFIAFYHLQKAEDMENILDSDVEEVVEQGKDLNKQLIIN